MADFVHLQPRSDFLLRSSRNPGKINSTPSLDPGTGSQSGNQASRQFGQSCPLHLPGPGACPFGGICHACPGQVQKKVKIGQPGDKYEQEAERMANAVTQTIAWDLGNGVQPGFESCQVNGRLKGIDKRSEMWNGAVTGRERPKELVSGTGRPLPRQVRDHFAGRLGHAFTQVRIHTDQRAAATARQIGARAFTYGTHIVFGAGAFEPSTNHGRRLLAHELVHVVQQRHSGIAGAGGEFRIQMQPLGCTHDTTQVPPHRDPVDELGSAHDLAHEWVEDALKRVELRINGRADVVIQAAINHHFSNPTPLQLAFIRIIYQRMLARLNQGSSIYKCNTQHSARCTFCGSRRPRPTIWACTFSGGRNYRRYRTTICPQFFRHPLRDRAHCLVHESAHNAGLQGEGRVAYPGRNPTYNAEPYARFAMD